LSYYFSISRFVTPAFTARFPQNIQCHSSPRLKEGFSLTTSLRRQKCHRLSNQPGRSHILFSLKYYYFTQAELLIAAREHAASPCSPRLAARASRLFLPRLGHHFTAGQFHSSSDSFTYYSPNALILLLDTAPPDAIAAFATCAFLSR